MRDEIQAGLKNAIERGDSLEQAIQSFISAGYNPVEVKEAASTISSNVSPIISNINSSKTQVDLQNKGDMFTNIAQSSTRNSIAPKEAQVPVAQSEQPKSYEPSYSPSSEKTGFHSKKVVIILLIILLVLGGLLTGLIFFSDTLLKMISGTG